MKDIKQRKKISTNKILVSWDFVASALVSRFRFDICRFSFYVAVWYSPT